MHQKVSLEKTPPKPGTIDVWEYYLLEDFLEVGGEVRVTHVRSFLYYLASPQTQAAMVTKVDVPSSKANVRVFGPVCDSGGPLYCEMMLSSNSLDQLYRYYVPRLLPEELEVFRKKLKEHVKEKHPLFPHRGICGARRLLSAFGLPYVA